MAFCIMCLVLLGFCVLAFFAPSSPMGGLICGQRSVNRPLGEAVADTFLRSYPYVGWWVMPVVQPDVLLRSLAGKLAPFHLEELPAWSAHCRDAGVTSCDFPADARLTWGSGDARTVANAMYMGTAIQGVIGDVPEKLRGVFWVRGGDGTTGLEELAVLQYGRWFARERVYVVPQAPLARAWAVARPANAPFDEDKYYDLDRMREDAWLSKLARGSILKFGTDDFSLADVQSHAAFGAMRDADAFGALAGSKAGTLEEHQESGNGTRWKRGCYFGWNGCNPLDMGSYELVKIISAEGNFVQPHYREFLEFMGDTQLFVHTGWGSMADREKWANWYYDVTGGKPAKPTPDFDSVP